LLANVELDVPAIFRAQRVELQPGQVVAVCSPEDPITHELVSTRPRDHPDVEGVVRRQGDVLDNEYVLAWLRQFEIALDDSTLADEYRRLLAR
jgi:hypothetical protein